MSRQRWSQSTSGCSVWRPSSLPTSSKSSRSRSTPINLSYKQIAVGHDHHRPQDASYGITLSAHRKLALSHRFFVYSSTSRHCARSRSTRTSAVIYKSTSRPSTRSLQCCQMGYPRSRGIGLFRQLVVRQRNGDLGICPSNYPCPFYRYR